MLHEDYRARAEEIRDIGNHLVADANARGEKLPRMVRNRREGFKATPEEVIRRMTETGVLDCLKRAVEGLRLIADLEEAMIDMSDRERGAFTAVAMMAIREMFDTDDLAHAKVGLTDTEGI